jgi:hypothetical protein
MEELLKVEEAKKQYENEKAEKTEIQKFGGMAIEKIKEQIVTPADYKEALKEVADIKTTEAAFAETEENAGFHEKKKNIKQREYIEHYKAAEYEEQAKKIEAIRVKNEAFYNSFRPILEFDFSSLIPKRNYTALFKKKNETKEQEEEKPKKTYGDRSYGLSLMVLMLFVLVIPYFVITVILAIFNGIDVIFNAIARFGKPALIICGSIAIIALMVLLVYGASFAIEKLFGIDIPYLGK